jgi:hypothetical protein
MDVSDDREPLLPADLPEWAVASAVEHDDPRV